MTLAMIPCSSECQFFTGWMLLLMPNQQCQNTEGQMISVKYVQKSIACIISYSPSYLYYLLKVIQGQEEKRESLMQNLQVCVAK